ncbi:putative CGG triplet repeat-binding protein 1-like 19 [Homarus americanus]|uniref:Putative CGG triplet repeat-binding protein 1-like 19 n=1 Tax=Homarus americanus TaxID=6706 RepID=A0A8J5JQ62_HOMAM|nr:putative CGG triplet repeat-binding protein 1-like 19 [Homarus americanus]
MDVVDAMAYSYFSAGRSVEKLSQQYFATDPFAQNTVTASKKFQVQQHLKTSKHIRLEAVKSNSAQKEQQLLLACSSKSGPDRSQFNADLCKAFVSADIPLHKLNNKCLKSFLEQYTGKKVPDESTLRKNYVSQLFKDTMEIIRRKACGKKIWVSLDETTDVEQRCIVNLIFGVLGDETERGKYYLAPSRTARFSEIAPSTPLPPSPVVTRWGSWIDAATYYGKNFDVIEAVIATFDPEEAQSIQESKILLETEGIKESLLFIATNFACS